MYVGWSFHRKTTHTEYVLKFKGIGGNIILMSILKCNCNQKMLTLTHYSQDFKNIKEYELNQLNMLTAYCTFTALYLAHKSQFLSFKWNFTSVVISYFAWEIWSCLGKASAISILSVLLMWMFCSIFVGFFNILNRFPSF